MSQKILLISLLILCLVAATGTSALTAEKFKLGSSYKVFPGYHLPVLAAEEKGFWKQNGLEVEWVPFAGTTPAFQGIASGSVPIALIPAIGGLIAAAGGVPAMIVSDLYTGGWFVWVRTDSRLKEMKDLKGAKIGVPRMGGAGHAYGQAVGKALGIEKELKFVGAGGFAEELAGLKAGAFDAVVEPMTEMITLKERGEVREIGNVLDFLPKKWLDHAVFAQKEFVKKNPDTVKRTIKAILQAIDFVDKNPRWSMDKMKAVAGYSEKGADTIYRQRGFSATGKIDREAVENLRNFGIDYGLVVKEKTPPTDELYTKEFTG